MSHRFIILFCFSSVVQEDDILSKPNNVSSKSICLRIARILIFHKVNLVLHSNNRILYFINTIIRVIEQTEYELLSFQLLENNGKYNRNEKDETLRFTRKTQIKKKPWAEEL